MATDRFNVETLSSSPELFACRISASRLFSLARRSIIIPAGWMALVPRVQQDPIVLRSGQVCSAADAASILFTRTSSIPCSVEDAELQSNDGHAVIGFLRVHVRVLNDVPELAAFGRNVLRGEDSLAISHLEQRVQGLLKEILRKLAGNATVEQLVGSFPVSDANATVKALLGPLCLCCGLEIVFPVELRWRSPAYAAHRREQADLTRRQRWEEQQQQIEKARQAARNAKLEHLSGMIERLQQMTRQEPGVSLAHLLTTFNQADRGEMYAALWRLCPPRRPTRHIAVVTSREILLFDATNPDRTARRVRPAEVLGALRSISVDDSATETGDLFVGAARGVLVVDIERGATHQVCVVPDDTTRTHKGGFNAVAANADYLFGTHSELGLVVWPREGESPVGRSLLSELTRTARVVREVQIAGAAVWLTIDNRVVTFSPDDGDAREPVSYLATTELSALAVGPTEVIAGDIEGRIMRWSIGEPDSADLLQEATGRPVESLAMLNTAGIERLVIADHQPALTVQVLGDSYRALYGSPTAIVRRAAASEDILAALNDRRDRLILWNPADLAAPRSEIIIPHIAGATAQDLCLIPGWPSPSGNSAT